MATPRIVLDTNVLVAALRSRRGASFRVVSLIGAGRFSLHLSVPLVLEYEEVLLRQLDALPLTAGEVGVFLDYLCSVGEPHQIFYLWRPFLKDVEDDMVLELAVSASCEYLVTFNTRDFGGSETFGIEVVTPRAFLEEIEADERA